MKKMSRMKFVLIIEIVYIAILVAKCFGTCTEFIFDKYNLNKSIEGELVYFDDGSVGMEAQASEEVEILNGFLDLDGGAYRVKILYDSVSNYDNTSIDNSAGRVTFSIDNSNLKASDIWLNDGKNEAQSRIWLRYGGNNKVKITVRYHGNGKLAIKSIYIEEKREYRIIICIVTSLLFAFCDFLYFLFCKKSSHFEDEKTRFVILGVIGITVFSSLPYFADFLFVGHDMNFHLSRIISLANGLREFQIPHRMQFDMLNGYGYASPLYYGEIFLLLPAILYNFYVPVQMCYQVFVVFINFVTCIICYWCFYRMSEDWRKGLLGAALYTLSVYRMTNILVRAAVGEFTALMFFPLLIYGFYNIYTKNEKEKICLKDYIPVIISATGIINSHILSCEIAVIFVAFFLAINYKKTFKNVFAALLKCGMLTFFLNLWFIVPFLHSMGMEVKVADKDKVNMIEGHSAYLSQLFGIFHTSNGISVSWSAQNEMPLALGFPILLGIVIFLYVYIKKESWKLSEHKSFKAVYTYFLLGS